MTAGVASKQTRDRINEGLATDAALLLLAVNHAYAGLGPLAMEDWPSRVGQLLGAYRITGDRVTRRTRELLAATLTETGSPEPAPPVQTSEALAPTTSAGFTGWLYATRNRILRRELTEGITATEATAIEHRALQGHAIGEPFRAHRHMIASTTNNSDLFTGWRRIPEPGACPWCRALSDKTYKNAATATGLRYHNRCRCTAAPVAAPGG